MCGCVDVAWDKQRVSTEEAKAYADSIGALFMETSAKKDINVQELFVSISAFLCPESITSFVGTVTMRGCCC